jgi:hypothetical protein
VSVPPDQFDDGEPPDDEETPEEEFSREFVAWREDSDPPDWFYSAGDILGELEERQTVNLNIDPYESNFDTGHIVLHGYDEDTGEDLYWAKDWTKDEWMEFYYYTLDYYDDEGYWSEDYTPDML